VISFEGLVFAAILLSCFLLTLLLSLLSANDDDSLSDIAEGLNRLVKVKPLFFQDCFQVIFEITRRVCQDTESSDSLQCTLLEVGLAPLSSSLSWLTTLRLASS
jgi:hypothetical protein